MTAVLETAYKMPSAFYCLKFIIAVEYICLLGAVSVVYLLHRVFVKSYIV